jgi:hypothetical protein
MAGTIVTDRIESDASYASKVEIASPLVVSNTFAIPAGTVGAPALSPVGDTNTGIYFPAADAIGISTNGVARIRVTSAGNVGIGTNSPQGRLDVRMTGDGGRTANFFNTGQNSGWRMRVAGTTAFLEAVDVAEIGYTPHRIIGSPLTLDGSNDSVRFLISGTERGRIDSAGKVGIGTSSPGARLHVQDTAAAERQTLIVGNNNTQGSAQLATIVRFLPSSTGSQLIIPFVNQGNLNGTTVCRILGHGATFNDPFPRGFTISFKAGHLNGIISGSTQSWGGGGNFASISFSGSNAIINFTNNYGNGGIYVTIEYMTNVLPWSIDVPNIAMN